MSLNHTFTPLAVLAAALLPDLSDARARVEYVLDSVDELLYLGVERDDGSTWSEDELINIVEARVTRQETFRLGQLGISTSANGGAL